MAEGTWGPPVQRRTLAPSTNSGWSPITFPGTQYVAPATTGETDAERSQRIQKQLMDSYANAGPRGAPQSTAAQAGATSAASYTPYASERAPGAQQASYNPYNAASAGPAAQAEMTRLGQAALVGMPSITVERSAGVQVGDAQRAPDVRVGYTPDSAIGQASMANSWMNPQWATNPMDMQAAQIGPTAKAHADIIYAAKLGAMREAEAQRAEFERARGADLGGNDALRQRQMAMLDYLEGSAKGTNGPSAAEMQFQRNLDKAIATQRAQAAGANGTGRVTANLRAGYNIGELSQDANAQSAMLRAQEQQQARGQLLAGLESTRGQDINVAGIQQQNNQFNAGQANQASITNAQLGTATNQFNAGQENQATVERARLLQQAGIANTQLQAAISQFNAGQINAQQLAQAQLEQQAAQTNLQKNVSMNQFNTGLEAERQRTMAGLRTQTDIANAGFQTQAGLQTQQIAAQRNQLQAQIDSQGGMFNAAQANEMQRLQAQLEQSNNQFNAGQGNDIAKTRFMGGIQVGTFNAGAKNAFTQQQAALNSSERLFNAGAQNQMNQFNTGQQNMVGTFNAGQMGETSRFNAGQGNAVNMFNTGQANSVGMFNAGQSNQLGMFNAGQSNETGRYNAGLQNQVNIQNSQLAMQQQAQDDARKEALMNQYLQASGQQMNANQFNANTNLQRRSQNLGLLGGLLSGGAGVLAAAVSDERAKTDIKPMYSDERGKSDKSRLMDSYDKGGGGGDDDIAKLLDNLTAYKYRYKDPTEPGTAPGERYGIMAQDLERSPMGRSIVIDDGGRKKIDPSQAVGVLLAAMARMNQRVKKVEGKR